MVVTASTTLSTFHTANTTITNAITTAIVASDVAQATLLSLLPICHHCCCRDHAYCHILILLNHPIVVRITTSTTTIMIASLSPPLYNCCYRHNCYYNKCRCYHLPLSRFPSSLFVALLLQFDYCHGCHQNLCFEPIIFFKHTKHENVVCQQMLRLCQTR